MSLPQTGPPGWSPRAGAPGLEPPGWSSQAGAPGLPPQAGPLGWLKGLRASRTTNDQVFQNCVLLLTSYYLLLERSPIRLGRVKKIDISFQKLLLLFNYTLMFTQIRLA